MITEIVPKKFDTPMFWDEDDLAELEGTAVVG
jgi:SET domain-containing protein 6